MDIATSITYLGGFMKSKQTNVKYFKTSLQEKTAQFIVKKFIGAYYVNLYTKGLSGYSIYIPEVEQEQTNEMKKAA